MNSILPKKLFLKTSNNEIGKSKWRKGEELKTKINGNRLISEPEWAKNIETHQTLSKCHNVIMENLFKPTKDSKWCYEFEGYHMDNLYP